MLLHTMIVIAMLPLGHERTFSDASTKVCFWV